MTLTERQRFVLLVATGYAEANIDDVNDAYYHENGTLKCNATFGDPLLEADFVDLLSALDAAPDDTATA